MSLWDLVDDGGLWLFIIGRHHRICRTQSYAMFNFQIGLFVEKSVSGALSSLAKDRWAL